MSTSASAPASLMLADREQVLAHAAQLVLDSWRSFDRARPTHPQPSAADRERFAGPLPEGPHDPRAALETAAEVLDHSFSQPRPRYFAYIGSSGLEVGVLADALAAAHDVNLAVQAGGADLIEQQTVAWTAQFVGFGTPADGILASGGTVSNLTALAAARERALPGIRATGSAGRRMALYTSAEAHHSVRRAAEVLGIGGDNVRAIAVDAERRMIPDACERAIAADRRRGVVPVAIVATGGTTLTGAVDDLTALGAIARRHDLWLHVDGAYGLPAAATATAGPLFAGLDHVDSASVDAHKWLYVPKACSLLLVRERAALEHAFAHSESYIPHDADGAHAVDRTLEYSRPLRALKLWLAFRVHGAAAIRAAIERNLRQARLLADAIDAEPELELLHAPQLSAVCFRHRSCTGSDAAARTAALVDAINRDGRILIAGAALDGVPCLRACVVNFRTTDDDVRAIPAVVTELARGSAHMYSQ